MLAARARYCEGVGEVALLQLSGSRFAREERWLAQRCEKYAYEMEARRGELACSDEGAVGVSVVLGRVRRRGGLIYLSGSGSDEIISDYARDGRRIYPHSCFGGRWPADLAPIFPWCSFYGGSQRAFLMKEELVRVHSHSKAEGAEVTGYKILRAGTGLAGFSTTSSHFFLCRERMLCVMECFSKNWSKRPSRTMVGPQEHQF